PTNDLGRHQRRDLDADVVNGPGEVEALHARQHRAQAVLGEVAGQEERALRHARRSSTARFSPAIESTTQVASKDFRRSTLSRSMRRGKTLTIPPGAMVSSSGAVSQAKTIAGIRHLPAWAKTLVASVSEMPATHLATVFEVAGASTSVW